MSTDANRLEKPLTTQIDHAVMIPHFWGIILLSFVLAAIYYLIEREYLVIFSLFPWVHRLIIFEFSYKLNGVLFFIPLLYSAIVCWRRGTIIPMLVIWGLSLAIITPHIIAYSNSTAAVTYNLIYLSIPVLVIAFINLELQWRKRERKTLEERELERQTYLELIIKAQENERKRISQELHDDTIQNLLAIANGVQAEIKELDNKNSLQMRGHFENIRDTILRIIEDMRRLSLDLRPIILDNLGLLSALRWLISRFSEESHIHSQFITIGEDRKLSTDIEVFLFRFVQEALSNARRHSQATNVSIKMEFCPKNIKIIVQDNGIGFNLPQNFSNFASAGKLGLLGMHERANLLNGIFFIDSTPGRGTTVSMSVNT
jgi:two-component system, NarL family, sensor histidine kinase DegS